MSEDESGEGTLGEIVRNVRGSRGENVGRGNGLQKSSAGGGGGGVETGKG